jgi:urease accessory protein
MTEAALKAQNWEARLHLELRPGADRTRLVPLQRYGPMSVQRPFYPEGNCCHVYLLHPPGGVVGGDSLELQVASKPGTSSLFTAPGAAKFYLSAGDTARVRQQFTISADSSFEFLPNENIYFPGALVNAVTTIDTEPGACVLLWEKHCFGRPANRESFDHGKLRSKIELRRAGRLVYTELQRVDAAELASCSGFRGQPVGGTLLAYGAEFGNDALDALQQSKPEQGTAGISLIQPDLLLARYIGPATDDLDHYFISLWERLRPLLLGREACRPRIWNT